MDEYEAYAGIRQFGLIPDSMDLMPGFEAMSGSEGV
jgi:hypothetical protein